MNLFQSLAETMRQCGLSDYEAHHVQNVHRSAGGKLWHLNAACGRLRRSNNVITDKVDLASAAAWPVCGVCCPSLPENLRRLERLAYSFRECQNSFEAAQKEPLGWGTLGKCESIIDQISNLQTYPSASVWHPELSTLAAQVRAFLESVRPRAVSAEVVSRACAVEFFNGAEAVANTDYCTLGSNGSYSGSQRRNIDQYWRGWAAWVANGNTFEEAHAEASKTLYQTLGDAPTTFDQLPTSTAFRREDFPSLKDWLRAEWVRERDESLAAIAGSWRASAEKIIENASGRPDSIVLCPLDTPTGYRESDKLRLVVAPFAPRRLASSSTMVVVRLPYLVAEWVDKAARSNYRTRWFGRVEADDSDSNEMLDVVAGLLDYNAGEMANLDSVVQVARATLS